MLLDYQVIGQDTVPMNLSDTLKVSSDSIVADTLGVVGKKYALEAKVDYKSDDSIIFDIPNQKAFLYQNAALNYQKTDLKAAYVEIDFSKSMLYATFLLDSLNKETGVPVFTDGDQSFTSKEMKYNFDTKKGLIKNVITQEGDGYLHGTTIKKLENNIIDVKSGSYTTCNLPHPHYGMHFKKAKIIPDDKIITGPAWMVIEDVPIPLALPFGLFPIFKGRTSGIIVPTWGESPDRGFYLENGGYYWGISDYFDLTVKGDIYSRGSWAIKPLVSYKKRYKFSGTFGFSYAINKFGDAGTPGYQKKRDFSIRWSHTQDPKSMPNSTFSASVNIVSSSFNRYNPVSTNDYLSNTFQSSISYQKSWSGLYHLTVSLNHSQNTQQKNVILSLPNISFSVNRFYPFRKKVRVGKLRWYEDISVTYTMNAQNNLNTYDSLLFTKSMMNLFKNGMKHTIPVSSSLKVLKYFNLTNSISYTERWYTQRVEKAWVNDTVITSTDTLPGYVKSDTIYGFQTARDFNFSSSLSTKLYGMVQFRKGPLRAIRHVMTPSIGFTLRPDFGSEKFGYWKYYYLDETKTDSVHYSLYQNSIYGTPPDGKSGSFSFSLNNNLEIKVRSKKDTITGTKKVVLIDNFYISTSYDLARDSLKWAPISMSGRTKLFRNLNVQFNGRWDLYAIDDSTGTRINTFQWEKNHKLLRFDNMTWNFSLNWNLTSKNKKNPPLGQSPSAAGTQDEIAQIMAAPDQFLDWNNPWRINISYNLQLIRRFDKDSFRPKNKITQTLSFNGDVNITPKWKIGFRSGYDFEGGGFSYTSFDFYRDLHCWEMRFNWIPIGPLKSWNFSINAKAPLLQDLKLQKKKDFRDSF
ncbi:MAG: putative LPS assembly protein LptD [Bacteroidetes bacterium]|nr:putative LPS assembly protein LptD [Bacteroidota bacterium]